MLRFIQVRLNRGEQRDKDISAGLERLTGKARAEFVRCAVYDALYPKYEPGVTLEDIALKLDVIMRNPVHAAPVEITSAPVEIIVPEITEDDLALSPEFTAAVRKVARQGMGHRST